MPQEAAMEAIRKIREACDELEASYAGSDENAGGSEKPAGESTPAPAPLIPGNFDSRRY